MKTKTFIIAGICGGIANWLLARLSYGIILEDYFPQPTTNTRSLTYIFLGCLSLGFFLSYFFNRWAQISTISTGAKAGAFFGLFLALFYGFIKLAMENSMTTELFTLDIAVSIGITSITGALVGYINGKV
ncbi:hypothetical protein [uncultured Winogradskyella sp.]|uniref:hypothetical protein n=1 Tax=uncultured Winogradskyella sp. TaxID=395353 RepID=UPI002615AF98|nr:hypothetical protein [uncultured Winogradskyella sp.]